MTRVFETVYGSDKLTIMQAVDVPAQTGPTEWQRGIAEFTRTTKLAKRAAAVIPGVIEDFRIYDVELEAFGGTAEACAAAVAGYLRAYPPSWGTRFGAVHETDMGFVASGSRYTAENWI